MIVHEGCCRGSKGRTRRAVVGVAVGALLSVGALGTVGVTALTAAVLLRVLWAVLVVMGRLLLLLVLLAALLVHERRVLEPLLHVERPGMRKAVAVHRAALCVRAKDEEGRMGWALGRRRGEGSQRWR